MKQIFFMILLASIAGGCSAATKVDNSTVKSLVLVRYIGDWYELARYDHAFERGMAYNKAHYKLLADGTIEVKNKGIKNGKFKETTAIAKTTNTPGLLKVSFCPPFYTEYRILMVDSHYQYALVGGKNKNHLWILARTPEIDEETWAILLTEADRRGYDINRVTWVEQ
jgi:apolipoprotein D and lipocalin family protein